MNDAAGPDGLTKDHLYCIGVSPSLRWAGVKGREAFVEVATYEAPHVTIQSLKRGMIEFPVADIVELRAGVEFWKRNFYRCMIRRRGAGKFMLYGSNHADDYRELVLHLAEEMRDLGMFDRVRRGLLWWENIVHLILWGGFALVLGYVPFEAWRHWGASWERSDYLLMAGITVFAVAMFIWTLWTFVRWYWPRRARDMANLAKVLP